MCVQLLERSFNIALMFRKKGLTKVMVKTLEKYNGRKRKRQSKTLSKRHATAVLNSIDLHLHTYIHTMHPYTAYR